MPRYHAIVSLAVRVGESEADAFVAHERESIRHSVLHDEQMCLRVSEAQLDVEREKLASEFFSR